MIWRRKHVLSLQWRRNQRDGVSNHEPNHYIDVIMTTIASQITSLTFVYSAVYWDADQRKHQSSASLAFVWGTHRDRWIPRTKGQLRGKFFHLMTSSWWLFTQLIIHAQLKENIKAPHDWYLWGEFTGDQRIPHTRASNVECFHWCRHHMALGPISQPINILIIQILSNCMFLYFVSWSDQPKCYFSLRSRHNKRDGVSNNQPRDCLFSLLIRRRSKKTSKLRVTGLCEGNSPVTGEFPAQRASNAENVPIRWYHHVWHM